jgi:hypothetical protein
MADKRRGTNGCFIHTHDWRSGTGGDWVTRRKCSSHHAAVEYGSHPVVRGSDCTTPHCGATCVRVNATSNGYREVWTLPGADPAEAAAAKRLEAVALRPASLDPAPWPSEVASARKALNKEALA